MIQCNWKLGLGLALVMALLITLTPRTASSAYDDDRQRLESMTPEQIDALRRNKERFSKMSPAEQQRIRDLHTQLEQHENSEKLKSLLSKYTTWLRNLPAGQRAELLSMPSQERMTKIREIMQRQAQERFRRLATDKLTNEDYKALTTWARNLALTHKEELIKGIPESFRSRFDSASDKERSGILTFSLLRSPERINVTQGEVKVLVDQLSKTAKETLAEANGLEQKLIVVREWVKMAYFSRMRFGERPPVPEKDLTEFYNKLDERAKEYLNGLPSERMKRELEAMYHNRSWMSRRRGMGPGRAGRGGFGGSGFGSRRGGEESGSRRGGEESGSRTPDNRKRPPSHNPEKRPPAEKNSKQPGPKNQDQS